ncbi:MAG TPA: DUF4838 domain-containing protein [bacterium]|nr:DUF4838 domain-containing protein [bacterium]
MFLSVNGLKPKNIFSVLFTIILGILCTGNFTYGKAVARIDAITRNHSSSKETVLLADKGVAKLPIIISDKASKDTRTRAEELAGYLEKITGAKFEVKTGTGTDNPAIFLGTIAEFPTPSAADGLKIYDIYDGRDAYAIRTEQGCVKLLGATELGVSHAMSRFLTLLGCRWFFPGPTWEVIPKISRLSFNINETDRPEVLGMYFGYDMGQQYEPNDPDAGQATKSWNRKNLLASGFKSAAGHCAHNVVQRFWNEFQAHPEMRALIKDENGNLIRTGTGPETPPGQPLKPGSKSWGIWGQLCVSNPETQKLVIRYVQEQFDKNPNLEMAGVGPDDGGGWCLCPECAKLGDCGNQAFYLANIVAKAIQKSHPGKLVGLLAYNWHCDPPDFPLEQNIYVELTTTLLINTKYGFDRLLELWPTKVKYVGLYDYWAVYDWTRDNMPAGRTGNLKYVAEKIPYYIKHGLSCMRAECGNSWGGQGLGYCLAIHLMWNTSVDVEALKNDFYEKAFGPAAKEMKAYYEHTDLGNEPIVGPAFYRICCDYLEAAEKAAAGRQDVLARIEQLKEYNVYVYMLNKERDTNANFEERKKWAFETLKWNYRIRNTYMTFWTFFAGMTTKQWANEFKEPTWNWYENYWVQKKPEQIPYRDPNPITPEETAAWFQKMKEEYGTVPKVTPLTFSKRLVAPEWPAKIPPEKPSQPVMHGPFTYALASMKGEPLRFSMNNGTMYPNSPPGTYVLTDTTGKEITRGTVPICPKTPTQVEIKVPSAGVYYFKFNDSGAGTLFIPDQNLRAAFIPEGPRGYTMLRGSWFYVPKGTTEIQLAASCGGVRMGIRDPEGKWLECKNHPYTPATKDGLNFKADGYYYIIPVPKGMDGKMWGLMLPQFGGVIHFFNIPTILCMSPDGPIIPEEVAKKDGLKW